MECKKCIRAYRYAGEDVKKSLVAISEMKYSERPLEKRVWSPLLIVTRTFYSSYCEGVVLSGHKHRRKATFVCNIFQELAARSIFILSFISFFITKKKKKIFVHKDGGKQSIFMVDGGVVNCVTIPL